MDTIDNIIKFCKNPKKEDDCVGYDLYLELKKNSSISWDFYAVLDRYAKCYHEDTGIVSEKEFCVLRELIDLIQNKGIADIIDFVEKNKAYKEACCVGNVFLETKHHDIAVLIQAYCLIGASGAEEKKYGRNLLLNWLLKDIVLKDKFSDAWLEDLETRELFYMVKWYIEEREFLASKFMRKEFL